MAKQRSRAYPSIDLKAAVQRTESIYKNLGQGTFSRDEIALGMGYKGVTGTSGRAVAALVHFGLLERRKAQYALSEVGRKVASPTDSGERAEAIKRAATTPSIFHDLVEQYKDQGLPELRYLANMLGSPNYGISPAQKNDVAHIFVSSLEFAGLISGNQFTEDSEDGSDEEVAVQDTVSASDDVVLPLPAKPLTVNSEAPDDMNRIEIVLREGIKAGIYAPYNLSEAEKGKLKTIIDLL